MSIDEPSYREFHSVEEANEWADTHYAELLDISQEDELYKLILFYTGSWYKSLNQLLRICPPLGTTDFDSLNFDEYEDEKKEIIKINRVLNHYSLPENIIVHRYTHLRYILKMTGRHILRKGCSFSDRAFLSTTLVKDQLKDFARKYRCDCVLRIGLPEGMHGACVNFEENRKHLNEPEFLLPPNTKLKITKIHLFTWPVQIDCVAHIG